MFGLGRKNFNSSMTSVYVFLFILITNQFLIIHSYVYIHHGQDQNQLENSRSDVFRQLISKYLTNSDDSSFDDDNNLQTFIKPTIERRFCCMSPLSGRKRYIRDLTRKRQLSK